MKTEKKCPICKKTFNAKRINQVYCNENDYACRIFKNNEKARLLKQMQGETPKIIKKNWEVMDKLLTEKREVIVSREFLKGAGVDLSYFTSYKKVDGIGVYMTNNICMNNMDNTNYKLYR